MLGQPTMGMLILRIALNRAAYSVPLVHDPPYQRLFELEVDSFRPTAKVVGVDDGGEEAVCHEGTDIGLFDPVVAAAVRGHPQLLQANLVALKRFGREIEKVDN